MRKHRIRSVIAGSLVAAAAFLLGAATVALQNPEPYVALFDAYRYRHETRSNADFLHEVVQPRLTRAGPVPDEEIDFIDRDLFRDGLPRSIRVLCSKKREVGRHRVATCQYRH